MNTWSISVTDLVQFGAAGAVVAVVWLFLDYLKKQEAKRDQTYREVAKALKTIAAATDKNTRATINADNYIRERNGRDNKFHSEVMHTLQQILTGGGPRTEP